MNTIKALIFLVIVASFVIGCCVYPYMPSSIASHWNINGEVDGYMSKFWGIFLMPIISLFILLLFLVIPKIDPLRENIKGFKKYFDGFILLITLFLFYIYSLTILWNLGLRFDLTRFMAPAIGALFFYCGILIGKSKRNWSIGIRTPWTLSSDKVWDETHRLGGLLFEIAGVIALFGFFVPQYSFALILVPVILFALVSYIYSYFVWRKYR